MRTEDLYGKESPIPSINYRGHPLAYGWNSSKNVDLWFPKEKGGPFFQVCREFAQKGTLQEAVFVNYQFPQTDARITLKNALISQGVIELTAEGDEHPNISPLVSVKGQYDSATGELIRAGLYVPSWHVSYNLEMSRLSIHELIGETLARKPILVHDFPHRKTAINHRFAELKDYKFHFEEVRDDNFGKISMQGKDFGIWGTIPFTIWGHAGADLHSFGPPDFKWAKNAEYIESKTSINLENL